MRSRILVALAGVLLWWPLFSMAGGDHRHGMPVTPALDPTLMAVLERVAVHVSRDVPPVPWDEHDAVRVADYLLYDWQSGRHEFRLHHLSPYGDADNSGQEEIDVEVTATPNPYCPSPLEGLPVPGTVQTRRVVYRPGVPLQNKLHESTEIYLGYAGHGAKIYWNATFAPPGAVEERAMSLARAVHDAMLAEGIGAPCVGAVAATPSAPLDIDPLATWWPTLIGLAGVLGVGALIAIIRTILGGRAQHAAMSAGIGAVSRVPNPAAVVPLDLADVFLTPVPMAAHQQTAAALAAALGQSSEAFTSAHWGANAEIVDAAERAALEAQREQAVRAAFAQMQQTLGVKTPIKLVFEDNADGKWAGQFRPNATGGAELMIHKTHSQWNLGPHQVLDTLAHELRHACQWDPTHPLEGPDVRAAATHNEASYIEPETDFASYSEQFVERDAVGFAKLASDAIARQGYLSRLDRLQQALKSIGDAQTPWKLAADSKDLAQLRALLARNPQLAAQFQQLMKAGSATSTGGS